MSDTGQDSQAGQNPDEAVVSASADERITQNYDDLNSDVSNEYDELMSWPSDESDYPHTDEEEEPEDDDDDTSEGSTSKERPIRWHAYPQPTIRIPFTGDQPGLKCQTQGTDPIHYYSLLASEEFYSLVLSETNDYAAKILAGPNSNKFGSWEDLTLKELKLFFGIFYDMGNIAMEKLENYWEFSSLFGSRFSRFMTCNRFLQIMKALHFARDPEGDDYSLSSHIRKVQPLIDLFNRTMKNIHAPARQLLVGDSLLLRMNDLTFRVHVKHKSHRSGLKIYSLQESSGFIQKFVVYSRDDDEELADQSYVQITLALMQDYLDRGYSLYPDVLHNSIELTRELLKRRTYCTGGLRVTRKNNPMEVLKARLKRGEGIDRYTEDNICVVKWKDKGGGPSLMLSSEMNGQLIEVEDRRGIQWKRPALIESYNHFVKTFGDQEELILYVPCEHVKMRWYKKLSTYVFHLMMANAYYMFKKYGLRPRMPFFEFRNEIIKELIQYDLTEP